MEEYESAKLSFQIVIDKFYDTSYFINSKKEMVIALAKNKETDFAKIFLESNKALLAEKDLYNEARKAIEHINSRLAEE